MVLTIAGPNVFILIIIDRGRGGSILGRPCFWGEGATVRGCSTTSGLRQLLARLQNPDALHLFGPAHLLGLLLMFFTHTHAKFIANEFKSNRRRNGDLARKLKA